jgi:hypothetical protein
VDADAIGAAIQAGLENLEKYPAYKFGDVARPLMFLVVDDCQSSPIFQTGTKHSNSLSALCIRNRHIGGLEYGGLSIIIAMQNWKAAHGALSKNIRMQLTNIALWRYRDRELIDDIYNEVANDISEQQFRAAYEYATQGEKWNMLFIEFNPVRLRRNFDEEIVLESLPQQNGSKNNVDEHHDGHANSSRAD